MIEGTFSAADTIISGHVFVTGNQDLLASSPGHESDFPVGTRYCGKMVAHKRTADDFLGLLQRARAWLVRQGGRCQVALSWAMLPLVLSFRVPGDTRQPCDRSRCRVQTPGIFWFLHGDRSEA